MIIAKYNISKGKGSSAVKGSTAVAGGGGGGTNIDITPITDKVAALESKVSSLESQLGRMQSTLAGLDSRFLSRLGDRSDYSYYLGAVYTDYIQSELFGNGVGFRISGNATAAVEDKYNLIVKDVGWASVSFTTVQQSAAVMVDSDTDEATAQLSVNTVSIGQTLADGFLLIDCGATLTSERCFTSVAKAVQYRTHARLGQRTFVSEWRDADTDPNGRFILSFSKADNISVDIIFKWTYAFRHIGQMTSGTYRLYISGTDAAHNRTDVFGAANKVTTVNATGISVINGDNGTRLTSSGLETTSDGGTTWA